MFTEKCSCGLLALVLIATQLDFAQSSGSPGPANSSSTGSGAVSALVQPALQQVQRTVGSLNTGRWKAPGEVKADADRNLASIQRDLVETLPGLITQADAAAGSVPPTFAVYRNVDALYDVLLRVNQTAILAAPDKDASAVASALQGLESARKQLGDAILASAQDREARIVQLETEVKAAAAAAPPPAPARPTVVDDGPAKPAAATKRRKAAAKPAPKPAAPAAETAPPSN